MNIVIFANGDISDNISIEKTLARQADYIICCDGGLLLCNQCEIQPNIIIGDMDSVSPHLLNEYKDVPIEKHNSVKDETDLELGINHALTKNPSSITLLGGFSSDRFDHQLGNIQALAKAAEKGINCRMSNEFTDLYIINKNITIQKDPSKKHISIMPFTSQISGVITKGLGYPLDNETLTLPTTRGISNYFTKNQAEISINSGIALIICT